MIISYLWCPEQDSNLHVSQHSHLKRARLPFRHLGQFMSLSRLPTCLSGLDLSVGCADRFVGVKGFEPSTPCSQSRCANRTALRPEK